jgi:hypothetical protein
MDSLPRSLRLSTLALEHVPLLPTTREHIELALRELDWASYDGAKFLRLAVHKGRVSMLQFAYHVAPDQVHAALHSEACRGLLLDAFAKNKSKYALKRVLEWLVENVNEPVIRSMSTYWHTRRDGAVDSLDLVAYTSNWEDSFHDLVLQDLATADLLLAADHGFIFLLEREQRQFGVLDEIDDRVQFLRLSAEVFDLEHFSEIAQILKCRRYALSALMFDDSDLLEPYLEKCLERGITFKRTHISSALNEAARWNQPKAFDMVAKRFLGHIKSASLVADIFRARGLDELQRNWDKGLSTRVWKRWRAASGPEISDDLLHSLGSGMQFRTGFVGPIAGQESRKRKRSDEDEAPMWTPEELIDELTAY